MNFFQRIVASFFAYCALLTYSLSLVSVKQIASSVLSEIERLHIKFEQCGYYGYGIVGICNTVYW